MNCGFNRDHDNRQIDQAKNRSTNAHEIEKEPEPKLEVRTHDLSPVNENETSLSFLASTLPCAQRAQSPTAVQLELNRMEARTQEHQPCDDPFTPEACTSEHHGSVHERHKKPKPKKDKKSSSSSLHPQSTET